MRSFRPINRLSNSPICVYDPELVGGSAEDKAMAYALALGKPTLLIYPGTWKKKWLNVPSKT